MICKMIENIQAVNYRGDVTCENSTLGNMKKFFKIPLFVPRSSYSWTPKLEAELLKVGPSYHTSVRCGKK